MIKPTNADMTDATDIMIVVQVGQVKISLPPRLSKIVQHFNEGNLSKLNDICSVHLDRKEPANGQVMVDLPFEQEYRHSKHNGFHDASSSPTSDFEEYNHVPIERRDYRGLVKVHKTKRRLPELPSDPKMSIFNNIDKLGVLEAELDVKKLEVRIRKQRQKVAAEFRMMSPEQRQELVEESPYLQKQIHRAIHSRNMSRNVSTDSQSSSTTTLLDSYNTSISTNQSSSTSHVTSFSSQSPCSTPKHMPPPPTSEIDMDSTIDFDDDVILNDSHVTESRDHYASSPSPGPLFTESEEELLSACSSSADLHIYTTASSTPVLSTIHDDSTVMTSSDHVTMTSSDHVTMTSDLDEELPAYSELTFVSPLKDADVSDSVLRTSASTVSRDPSRDTLTRDISVCTLSETSGDSNKTLSDSAINTINVTATTPPAVHFKRSEVCTPHVLSLSDSQLIKRPKSLEQPYERAQSVPYGIEKKSVTNDISDILSKKFAKNADKCSEYSSKSISDKLEQIESKLSPRSFFNHSQSISSYTLSYEEDMSDLDIEDYGQEIQPKDNIAINLSFSEDNDEFVQQMNRRNDKENIINGFVSIGMEDVAKIKAKQDKEDATVETVADRLCEVVLDHLIFKHSATFQPPPYVSTAQIAMRVSHSTEEIREIADETVEHYMKCLRCGQPVDPSRVPTSLPVPEYADPASYAAFVLLINTQTFELFIQACTQYRMLSSPETPPPWIREQIRPPRPRWLLKHSLSRRPDPATIKVMICEEVTRVIVLQQDSIENMLSKEVVQGDALWQDFNKDEVALKFRLADVILADLLQGTVETFKQIEYVRTEYSETDPYSVEAFSSHPPPIKLKRNNSF